MHSRKHAAPCAVCEQLLAGPPQMLRSRELSRVIVEGRTVLLCRLHAATVAANMPATFEELRALFKEPVGGERGQEHPARRSLIERRGADDRRLFPPRPEGRRMDISVLPSGGRRLSQGERAH